jgi:flagellar assembly protein FliH
LFTKKHTHTSASMADTPPARKFLFDRSFDDGSTAARGHERKPVTLKPEQVDALKKEAYDAGLVAGQKAVGDAKTEQLAELMGQIEKSLHALVDNVAMIHKQQKDLVGALVLSVARRILPDYTGRHGLQEIQALLDDTITEMVHEPRLVVRIHLSQFDAANTYLQAMAAQKAYAGKIVVLADTNVAIGDCRIEWADGGVERDTEATWKKVEHALTPEPTQPQSSP